MTIDIIKSIIGRYIPKDKINLFIEMYPNCLDMDREDLDSFTYDYVNGYEVSPNRWNQSLFNQLFWEG